MPTLETIEEVYEDVYEDVYEVYDMEPLGEPPEIYFNKDCWQSDWGQWTDIEYDYILVN
jgi:hypothetical protein